MKLKFFAVTMPLALLLNACDKQEDKFAGFTAVGSDKKAAKFYLDTNTVKRDRSDWVSFNMVRDLTDSYVIQNADTNCSSRFVAEEGVKYRQDGTSQEKFASETMILPIDNADVTALIKMACDKAEENRMITGAFDDGKALEILFGNYGVNTKTAFWEKIDPPSSLEGYEKFTGKTGTVKIMESKDFEQGGKTKHILLTSTSVSYSADVLLGAVVFVKNGEKWQIEKEQIFTSNTFNLSSKIHWEKIGNDNYAVIENGKYDNSEYVRLYDLTKQKYLINFSTYDFEGEKSTNLEIHVKSDDKSYSNIEIDFEKFAKGKVEKKENFYKFNGVTYEHYTLMLSRKFEYKNSTVRVDLNVTESSTERAVSNIKDFDSEYSLAIFNDDGWGREFDINAVTYHQINDVWQFSSEQAKIGLSYGCFNAKQEIKTIKLLPDKIAFLVNTGNCGGNHTTNIYQDLYLYDKNRWHNLGKIQVGESSDVYDDECKDGCWNKHIENNGVISIIKNAKEYPDLLVTKTGTEEIDGKIVPTRNTIYVFNGKEYEEKKDATPPTVKTNEIKPVTQDNSVANSLIIQMIDYAIDNGGVGHESEIQEAKLKIESFPKPKKGNKKAARKINDEGHALLNQQDIDGAVAKFSEANRLDASDVEIANNLGFAYLKQKNLELAQQALIATLSLAPARAAAWSNLGDVFALSGDEHKAVACYANTYRFSKDMAKTHQFMKKMNAAEDVPALKKARDSAMTWVQKVYPELE